MWASSFRLFSGSLQLRVNYRNHRKIVVIDGKTAFAWGSISDGNISDCRRNSDTGATPICASVEARCWLCISGSFWTGITRQSRILFARDSYFTYRARGKAGQRSHPDYFQRTGLQVAEYPQRLPENDQQGPKEYLHSDSLFHSRITQCWTPCGSRPCRAWMCG